MKARLHIFILVIISCIVVACNGGSSSSTQNNTTFSYVVAVESAGELENPSILPTFVYKLESGGMLNYESTIGDLYGFIGTNNNYAYASPNVGVLSWYLINSSNSTLGTAIGNIVAPSNALLPWQPIRVTFNNGFAYIVDESNSEIWQYQESLNSGGLSYVGMVPPASGIDNWRPMQLIFNNSYVYISSESSLFTYAVNQSNGVLSYIGRSIADNVTDHPIEVIFNESLAYYIYNTESNPQSAIYQSSIGNDGIFESSEAISFTGLPSGEFIPLIINSIFNNYMYVLGENINGESVTLGVFVFQFESNSTQLNHVGQIASPTGTVLFPAFNSFYTPI